MSVCVYSVFLLSCVHVAALRRADDSSKETYRLCKNDYEIEGEATAQQRAVEPLMNEILRYYASGVGIIQLVWTSGYGLDKTGIGVRFLARAEFLI
jgi:hypothetical protein